jgi:hypothetical protein
MRQFYKSTIILILLFLIGNAQAQNLELYSDINLGIPISNSLKSFHAELTDDIPFNNVEISDNFNYNYGFTIGLRFKGKASIFFANRISGAKSSIADYSGYVRLTNELNGYIFGLEYDFPLKEFSNGNLYLGVKGMTALSRVFLTSESKILNDIQEDNVNFNSTDYGGAVGLNYEYSFGFIIVRAHLDLDVYYGGKLKLDNTEFEGGFLTNDNGDKVTSSWTGISSGIGIIIPLIK